MRSQGKPEKNNSRQQGAFYYLFSYGNLQQLMQTVFIILLQSSALLWH